MLYPGNKWTRVCARGIPAINHLGNPAISERAHTRGIPAINHHGNPAISERAHTRGIPAISEHTHMFIAGIKKSLDFTLTESGG